MSTKPEITRLERELAEARAAIERINSLYGFEQRGRLTAEAERDALAADKARLVEAQVEKPHCRIDQSDLPLWQQINAIFERHGWSSPGTGLRDTLVMILAWARYGEALDAALSGASTPAPADKAEARRAALEEAVHGEWREVDTDHLLKGRRRSTTYFPATGETCEVSGPNCDNENGYTWGVTEVLWQNDIFVLYGSKGFWPVLHKHEHVLFRPVASISTPARREGDAT